MKLCVNRSSSNIIISFLLYIFNVDQQIIKLGENIKSRTAHIITQQQQHSKAIIQQKQQQKLEEYY
jgi:hypothetical protein